MLRLPAVGRLTVMLAGLGVAACGPSQEELRARHLEAGDRLNADGKADLALAEYRAAVEIDSQSGLAHAKLAAAYSRLDRAAEAGREYRRAAELLPTAYDAQLTAARALLLAGEVEAAQEFADAAVRLDNRAADASIALGNARARIPELTQALDEIGASLSTDDSLPGLRQTAPDVNPDADAAFARAVTLAGSRAEALLAQGHYFWRTGRARDALAAFEKASSAEPTATRPRHVAALLQWQSNPEQSVSQLESAIAKDGSPAVQFLLADLYVKAGRREDAATLLQRLASAPATRTTASLRLAALAIESQRASDAQKWLDGLPQEARDQEPALTLRAEACLADGLLDEALAYATRAVALNARSADAGLLLARSQFASGRVEESEQTFKALLQAHPQAWRTRVAFARQLLATNDRDTALDAAERALAIQPASLSAHLVVVEAMLARNQVEAAETRLASVLSAGGIGTASETIRVANPTARAAIQIVVGRLRQSRAQDAAARAAYLKALALHPASPEANTAALEFEHRAGHVTEARARAEALLWMYPSNTRLLLVAARALDAAGARSDQETALLRATKTDAASPAPHIMLGRMYLAQQRYPDARRHLEQAVAASPRSIEAATWLGSLLEQTGHRDEAVDRYKQIVNTDPRAALAASRLAFLYAERSDNLEVALQLAQSARGRLPNDPAVLDVLGWVYVKKELAAEAIPLLQQAVAARSDDPLFLFHLGMAYARNGDDVIASQTLKKALARNPSFPGASEARKMLEELQILAAG